MSSEQYYYCVQRVHSSLLALPVNLFDISVLCATSGLQSPYFITELNMEVEMVLLENSHLAVKNKQRTGHVC